MCGIAGILSFDSAPVDAIVLRQMMRRLAHRGPDGEGFLLAVDDDGRFRHVLPSKAPGWSAPGGARVGLGHRRLAILDLSDRGRQPMTAGDGSAWIVFNGEIYNHLELRDELEALGYTFTTRTDTEVLLQAYRQWGGECLARLEGMYAFAVWDSARRTLFCARDRLGIKPFYYATPKGHFIFASEIKALFAFPGLDRVADDAAILGFLAHGNCDYRERTVFRGVSALPAGHTLTVDLATGSCPVRRYWRVAEEVQNDGNPDERVERLRGLLVDAIRKHLVSDVRAGSCLSGGLDSSTVVGLVGKLWREEPDAADALGDRFHTFTSCYEYPEFDEREHAMAVAAAAGTTPTLVFPSPEDFWAEFERMAWHQDMPFGAFSFYAQWRVMRAAREAGIKVLLDGQGGDEVFGGYAKFRYAYLASLLRSGRMPTMLRELTATVRQRDHYVLDIRGGYRYLPRSLRSLLKVDALLDSVLSPDWRSHMLEESTPSTRWWRHIATNGHGHAGWTALQRIQVDDLTVDTLPTLLRMEDRSSMAFSLEARVPLLDHRVVEYGLSLPDDLKIRNGWSKFAVRMAMRGVIPDTVRLRRTKLGFAAPDRLWLSRDLRGTVMKLIDGELRCGKYVDPSALRQWYRSPVAQTANTESYLGLFRVLSLEMWMRAFGVS